MSKWEELLPCRCGRMPKLRYRMPFSWVQCKCGLCTSAYVDGYEQVDPDSVKAAIDEWNEKFGKRVEP